MPDAPPTLDRTRRHSAPMRALGRFRAAIFDDEDHPPATSDELKKPLQ